MALTVRQPCLVGHDEVEVVGKFVTEDRNIKKLQLKNSAAAFVAL